MCGHMGGLVGHGKDLDLLFDGGRSHWKIYSMKEIQFHSY